MMASNYCTSIFQCSWTQKEKEPAVGAAGWVLEDAILLYRMRAGYIIYIFKKSFLAASMHAYYAVVRTCRLERRLLAASTHAFVHGPKILCGGASSSGAPGRQKRPTIKIYRML